MSRDTVAVDGGRSGCRIALTRYGTVARPAASAQGLPLVAAEGGVEAVASMLAAIVREHTEDAGVVAAGLTGLFECMDRAPDLASRIRQATGAERVLVTGDVVTSHAGALGGRPGVVIAAGTGTVALGVAEGGRWARVDGWGFAVGDAGSGFAVGRAGLDAALRHHDGRGGSSILAERARERYGPLDQLSATLYAAENLPAAVAAFARDVAVAAHDGDSVARGIWHDAADQLARTAAAAARRVHDGPTEVPVACTGALFDAGRLVRDPFHAALGEHFPAAVPVPAVGDALDGAAILAADAAPALRPLVVTA